MKKIKFSKCDLVASEISLGCMRIAELNIQEIGKLVNSALDEGINFLIMQIYMVVVNLNQNSLNP